MGFLFLFYSGSSCSIQSLFLFCSGSSRMKGGSMTAILLNVVFSLAISRSYSIPLSQLLGTPDLYLPSHIPSPSSSDSDVTQNGTETEGNSCHLLSQGEREVALIVDAFQATYTSAYRSVNTCTLTYRCAGQSVIQATYVYLGL